MVSICYIPLTLHSLGIYDCEKLGYVELDDQPTSLSPGIDNEKSNESIGVYPKASLELPLLNHLSIQRCPSLRSLKQSLLLPALHRLELQDCKNMERLPAQLLNLTTLERVSIDQCPKIHSLVEGGLPRSLKSVEINDVNIKQSIQEWGLHLLHSLEVLTLRKLGSSAGSVECINEVSDLCLPSSSFSQFPNKVKINELISSADSVECILPQNLSLPSSLNRLYVEGFQNLKIISGSRTLPNLTDLFVRGCPRLESLVGGITPLTQLSINDCPNFHNFPEGGLPRNLICLSIRGTKIDKPIKEWGFHLLKVLHYLALENVGSCVDTVESIGYPDFPSSLSWLEIEGFQNLKTIYCSTLPKLYSMNINFCPKLESFGDNALPPHIKSVDIRKCDMIEQHLTSDPNGLIRTENGTSSLPLSGTQLSSAHSNIL